jgi:CheY-like chemotaxis protein
MTVLLVVLIFVGFVILDVVVRAIAIRIREKRVLRERKAVLETSVRLEFAREAESLKRSELPDARASILAVDDEPVVLDSLRKILVMEGYSVDTVESGPEALTLVRQHDYDFVFTDLKMPGMDGVEVVKAVHHLRPDTDIAVITGYATIESAIETMQHGAVAYVQKPFTPDELAESVKELVIKREARLEAQHRPSVRVVAPSVANAVARREFCVPGGTFLSDGHVWARLEPDGRVRVGLDDFARKALGEIEHVDLPQVDVSIRSGEPLFSVRRGTRTAHFAAPLSGQVAEVNSALDREPTSAHRSPYNQGWICLLQPSGLSEELSGLRIGQPVIEWYQEEIARLRDAGGPAEDGVPAVDWQTIEQKFFKPAALVRG